MLSTDAKAKTLAAQSFQESLALKDVSKYLVKVFKGIEKATKRGKNSYTLTTSIYLKGYEHYWNYLAKEISEELSLRGFRLNPYFNAYSIAYVGGGYYHMLVNVLWN